MFTTFGLTLAPLSPIEDFLLVATSIVVFMLNSWLASGLVFLLTLVLFRITVHISRMMR